MRLVAIGNQLGSRRGTEPLAQEASAHTVGWSGEKRFEKDDFLPPSDLLVVSGLVEPSQAWLRDLSLMASCSGCENLHSTYDVRL